MEIKFNVGERNEYEIIFDFSKLTGKAQFIVNGEKLQTNYVLTAKKFPLSLDVKPNPYEILVEMIPPKILAPFKDGWKCVVSVNGIKHSEYVDGKRFYEDPKEDPNNIQVFDQYGRDLYISKEEWRKSIVPDTLKKHWDNPDELYNTIVACINDGFFADVEEASRHLLELEPDIERAVCARSIVAIELGGLHDAEKLLMEFAKKHGPTKHVLINLSNVYLKKGDTEQELITLRESLKIDPNQEIVQVYAQKRKEKEGEGAYMQALTEIASFENSWMPQFFIARHYLENKNKVEANKIYTTILSANKDNPTALAFISGDLGNVGEVETVIQLIAPLYTPSQESIAVGLNLLRAYLITEKYEEGLCLLEGMYKLECEDIKNLCKDFEYKFQELRDKKTKNTHEIDALDIKLNLNVLHGSVWIRDFDNPTWLLPEKSPQAKKIGLLVFADIDPRKDVVIKESREDKEGKITRAIPLLLSDDINLKTGVTGEVIIATVENSGAYLVSGKEWSVEILEKIDSFDSDVKYSYIITGSIKTIDEDQYEFEIVLYKTSEKKIITRKSFVSGTLQEQMFAIERHLFGVLKDDGLDLQEKKHPAFYSVPQDVFVFEQYTNALSQSLSLTMMSSHILPREELSGQRGMLDNFLSFAVETSECNVATLMYLSGLLKNKKSGSDIYEEYKEKTLKLLEEMKERDNELYALSPSIFQLYGMHDESKKIGELYEHQYGVAYTEWLKRVQENKQNSKQI